MFGVLAALGAFCGLLWYLKVPRMVYWAVLGGAAALVVAARFLLPERHPFRVNAGDDLDGLVVVIFLAGVIIGYRYWFRSLKARKEGLAGRRDDQPEPGFVIIDDDTALMRDVEALLFHDSFSLLKRSSTGEIAASCRVVIDREVARLGPIFAPVGLMELLGEVEEECDWRDAKMLVVDNMAETDTVPYLEAGFEEFGRIETDAGPLLSMKKDLT